MTTSPASAYGAPFYFPAGTTARFRFTAKQTPTGQPFDLTLYTATLYLKTAETVADDATSGVDAFTVANDGLVIMDAALGIFDWVVLPADTSPAAYTPGAPWFRYVKLVHNTTGAAYVLAGSAGEVYLDSTAPAIGSAGVLVAYSPVALVEAIGPSSSPLPAYATTAYVAAALSALLTNGAATNASGNTTITLPAGSRHHTVDMVFTGDPGTRKLVADITGVEAGAVLRLDYTLPATADIVVEVHNATAGGTLLDTLMSDASGDSAFVVLSSTGTAWKRDHTQYPSN